MKRKLNAILALILAVMMIVPSAVVVTAAPDGLEVAVSGASLTSTGDKILDPTTIKVKETNRTVEYNIYLTDNGTVTLNVSKTSKQNVKLTCVSDNAVTFTGIEVDNKGYMTGSTITVTGDTTKQKTACIVLTAEESKKDPQIITLNFTVLPTKIIGMDAIVKVTTVDGNPLRSDHTLSDSDYYLTESYLEVSKLNVFYNNNAIAVPGTLANMKMGVGSTAAESKANLASVTKVQVFGGDEFVTILLTSSEEEINTNWEKLCGILRTESGTLDFDYEITASYGYATRKKGEAGSLEALMQAADEQMYKHKQGVK